MNELRRRQKAALATEARFAGKAFAWGSVDCAKLVAFHLKQFGYKVRLSKAGQYNSAASAKAALKRFGYNSLIEAMDGEGFARWPGYASARVADVVSLQTFDDDPFGALGIYLGQNYVLGFHEDHGVLVKVLADRIDIAWRVG